MLLNGFKNKFYNSYIENIFTIKDYLKDIWTIIIISI